MTRKEYIKNYRATHKEHKKTYDKVYRKKNCKIISKKMSIWFSSTKGIFQILKNNVRVHNERKNSKKIKIVVIREDFIKWYDNQEKNCYYCSKTLAELKLNVKDPFYKNRLSIDRKDNDKDYELKNMVLACYRCNTIKGDYFTEQEMLEIGKIIKNRKRGYNGRKFN